MENNPEYLASKAEFERYYDHTVVPSVADIEKKRKKYLLWFFGICFFIALWIGLLINGTIGGGDYGVIICFLVLAVCAPMLMYYKQSKESILSVLIGFFGNFTYIFRPVLSDMILQKGRIMKKYDQIGTDDGFEGFYEDIPVTITEYTRFEYRNRKKNDVTVKALHPLSHGIFFTAKMNKNFDGQTIVVKDKGVLNKIVRYKGLERVGLESTEFEKAYEVYSDNQVEARYILTSVMLEYMLELKKVFPKTEFSFFDNQVTINIELKENFFECSHFFRSVINKKRTEKIFKQFYLLFSIIKTLHLNEKRLL